MNLFKQSKRLSYILRHNPDSADIILNKEGYAVTAAICVALNIDMKTLEEIVITNNKKRFKFNHNKSMIKANQGHSIKVDLKLEPIKPPEFLYHGTTTKYMPNIEVEGLKKMNRHHVHLSDNTFTAETVGRRHGNLIMLKISALEMYLYDYKFYVTDNNVWLTDNVPYKYFRVIK